ncbi:MAG: ABC transporter permease [Proteobacteria bacterium]|nr:ABC transporter permease [Pseudomonadota bacterium]MBI3499653.1 ABC transporter permease [Pseudomonadota bacterium]
MTQERHCGFSTWLIAWTILAALVLPLIIIAVLAFSPEMALILPPPSFSTKWFFELLKREQFVTGITYSAELAVCSAAIGLFVSLGVAYAIARYRFPGRALIHGLVMSPLIIPEIVTGLGLLIWFNQIALRWNDARIVLLHILLILPFMVRVLTASLQHSDRNLEDAARLLGAHPVIAFARVTLPTIRQGLVAALVFAVVVSFHNFTATLFLITNKETLPITIFGYIRAGGSDPATAALSTVLIGVTSLIVLAVDRWIGIERVSR